MNVRRAIRLIGLVLQAGWIAACGGASAEAPPPAGSCGAKADVDAAGKGACGAKGACGSKMMAEGGAGACGAKDRSGRGEGSCGDHGH